jgi:NADH-quinone oxidoreductase subunit M
MELTVKISYTILVVILTTLSSLTSDKHPRLSKLLVIIGLLGVPVTYITLRLLILPDYQLVLLLMTSFVTTFISLHSTGYYRYMYGITRYPKLILNTINTILVLLFSSTILLELLVYWLLVDIIIAFTAITLERGYENLRVSATYLVMCIAPSDMALLTLWAILAANIGSYETLLIDITKQHITLNMGPLLSIILLFGFSTKLGQFPLHSWPPIVYGESPSHASAVLSSVVSKIGLLGYILSTRLFTIDQIAFYVILVQGLISTIYGAFAATLQTNIKRILAYSSISYYGVITILYAIFNLMNISQAYYLVLIITVYHGIVKALAFVNTGLIYQVANTYDIYRLGYLFYVSKPATLTGFIVLANLISMPPTIGFFVKISMLILSFKLLLLNPALVVVLIALIIHTVFAVIYSTKLLSVYTSTLPRAPLKPIQLPYEEPLSEYTLGFSTIALSALILWILEYSPILISIYIITTIILGVMLIKYHKTVFIPEEVKYWLTGVES